MDIYVAESLNQIVGQSVSFDLLLNFIQGSYFVKGLFVTVILVMIYTSRTGDRLERQNNVYVTLALVFVTLFIARILQMTLPFTGRPLYTEGLDLVLANGLKAGVLKHDSSFPSDHAVMFMTIASSVLLYARLAGVVLLCHALLVISLPRIILGFHWVSDVAAGLALGAAISLLLHRRMAGWLRGTRLSDWQDRYPSVFYGLLFIVLCETATMYSGSRHLLSALADFAKIVL